LPAAASATWVATGMGGLLRTVRDRVQCSRRPVSHCPGTSRLAAVRANIHSLITNRKPRTTGVRLHPSAQDQPLEAFSRNFQISLCLVGESCVSGRLGVVPAPPMIWLGDANGTGGGLSPNLAALNTRATQRRCQCEIAGRGSRHQPKGLAAAGGSAERFGADHREGQSVAGLHN